MAADWSYPNPEGYPLSNADRSYIEECAKLPRDNGVLIHTAWPGGYPIVYYTADGDTLCGECAQATASDPTEIPGTLPIGYDVLEGTVEDHGEVSCTNCNKVLVGPDAD